jgi:hypothetical protein
MRLPYDWKAGSNEKRSRVREVYFQEFWSSLLIESGKGTILEFGKATYRYYTYSTLIVHT